MSNDIERLLNTAADDSDQPLHTDIDAILTRGRRSVRRSRIAVGCTAALTTTAILGGVTAWSNTFDKQGTEPASSAGITIKDGLVVDDGTGHTPKAPPPVSRLSDAAVLSRCAPILPAESPHKQENPVDSRWKVVTKTGDQNRLLALLTDPDRSVVAVCTAKKGSVTWQRMNTSGLRADYPGKASGDQRTPAVAGNVQIPALGVAYVLADFAKEAVPRQALVGSDGFYTFGYPYQSDIYASAPAIEGIRAYDAGGKQLYSWKYTKPQLPKDPGPEVKIKAANVPPVQVEVTKDPETGKPLAATPPVSVVSDESIRTRCKVPDEAYLKSSPHLGEDKRPYDAGKLSPAWKVVLKTGTGTDVSALLVSPGENVVAWCSLSGGTGYDYGRDAVPATGKFGVDLNWGQVPDGVAQIVVDLPKTGPTKALIQNGYFIWGLTGGTSDIKNVRIRGFDAQGKQVYDAKHEVDAS